jgi:hypothetical protein
MAGLIGEDCRDLGHRWRRVGPTKWVRGEAHYAQPLSCTECGSERVRRLDASGYPIGNDYDYIEGFLRPPGSGRMTAADKAAMRLGMMGDRAEIVYHSERNGKA